MISSQPVELLIIKVMNMSRHNTYCVGVKIPIIQVPQVKTDMIPQDGSITKP